MNDKERIENLKWLLNMAKLELRKAIDHIEDDNRIIQINQTLEIIEGNNG